MPWFHAKKQVLAPTKNKLKPLTYMNSWCDLMIFLWIQKWGYEFTPAKNFFFSISIWNHIIKSCYGLIHLHMTSWFVSTISTTTWKWIFHDMIKHCEAAMKFWIISWHDGTSMNSYQEIHVNKSNEIHAWTWIQFM